MAASTCTIYLVFLTLRIAAVDVTASVRSALLSEGEVAALDSEAWPTGIVFDLDSLVKAIPDAAKRSRESRFPDAHLQAKRALGGPAHLLRLAFDGASPNAPEGETALPREHSPRQQGLQAWLFSRCERLPATGLRQECVKRVAAAAAELERSGTMERHAVGVTSAVGKLQAEAVVALGLGKRSSYLPDGELSASEDVHIPSFELGTLVLLYSLQNANVLLFDPWCLQVARATTAANDDAELQRLIKKPEVAAAMERIAANPSAINEYSNSPDVMDVLQRLNAKLAG